MDFDIGILAVVILLVGLVAIIGNQYSGLKQMRAMQRSLDDLNQKLREIQRER